MSAFAVGHRVMVVIGKPGAWKYAGRVTSVTEDPPRRGGVAIGVQFHKNLGSLYFAEHEIAHID